MSELALQLIREAKTKKLKSLNLGSCGLTELPPELFELVWLEELVVSNEQWHEEVREEEYVSGKLRKRYKVADLLDGIESPEVRQYDVPIKAFISYSHKDIPCMEALKTALSPLLRSNKVQLWDDGCNWMTGPKEDAAWTEIARGVEKVIQALQKRKQQRAREREMPFGRRE